jgi:hypothetical protein
LITFPVMPGHGKRWYSSDPATARSWTLVEQAHSPTGVHFASFARDGVPDTVPGTGHPLSLPFGVIQRALNPLDKGAVRVLTGRGRSTHPHVTASFDEVGAREG